MGVLYSRMNAPLKALDAYQHALKLVPQEPGLLLNVGLAYLKLDNHKAALPLFAMLASKPSRLQGQARELHAICQMQTGATAPAVATLEELAQQPGASPAVLHFLALGYVRLKQPERAQSLFDGMLRRLPVAEARFLEGRVWYDATVFDKALASYREAAQANANLPGLALELGKTLVSLRDYEPAEAALKQALQANPHDVEARYFLGALLVQQARHEEGQTMLEAVRAARPDLWGTSYYLGKAQLALGKPAAAVPLLREAARRAPDEAPVQYQLARALQASGQKAEAAAAFTRVAKLRADANRETIVMK